MSVVMVVWTFPAAPAMLVAQSPIASAESERRAKLKGDMLHCTSHYQTNHEAESWTWGNGAVRAGPSSWSSSCCSVYILSLIDFFGSLFLMVGINWEENFVEIFRAANRTRVARFMPRRHQTHSGFVHGPSSSSNKKKRKHACNLLKKSQGIRDRCCCENLGRDCCLHVRYGKTTIEYTGSRFRSFSTLRRLFKLSPSFLRHLKLWVSTLINWTSFLSLFLIELHRRQNQRFKHSCSWHYGDKTYHNERIPKSRWSRAQ